MRPVSTPFWWRSRIQKKVNTSKLPPSVGRFWDKVTSPAQMPLSPLEGEQSQILPVSLPQPGYVVCVSSTCPPPCWAWWTLLLEEKPVSTPPRAKTWSAHSTHRLVC